MGRLYLNEDILFGVDLSTDYNQIKIKDIADRYKE
jgi:hypothetical protein